MVIGAGLDILPMTSTAMGQSEPSFLRWRIGTDSTLYFLYLARGATVPFFPSKADFPSGSCWCFFCIIMNTHQSPLHDLICPTYLLYSRSVFWNRTTNPAKTRNPGETHPPLAKKGNHYSCVGCSQSVLLLASSCWPALWLCFKRQSSGGGGRKRRK